MRGGEGIVDEDVAELGQRLGEVRIVLLLALVEAQVLQHGDLAGLQRGTRILGGLADAVGDERAPACRAARPACRPPGFRLNSRIGRALGPAEMRDDDDPRAALGEILEARHDALQPRRVGHLAVLDRHVEIGAHEHALALDVERRRSVLSLSRFMRCAHLLRSLLAASATCVGRDAEVLVTAWAPAPRRRSRSCRRSVPLSPSHSSQPCATPASTRDARRRRPAPCLR